MNRKSYIEKINTIVYNSKYNTSQNPVCELFYGDGYSRVLIKVNTDLIQSLINDKTYSDTTKLKHVLKMKNTFGKEVFSSSIIFNSGKETDKQRTSSFKIHLVRMPENWDSGNGSDFTKDGFITNNAVVSENGSNWFNSSTETLWLTTPGVITGVTTGDSNIITTQTFETGTEDIEMDITSEVNNIISGITPNNGFMLCFDKLLEQTSTPITQYVGFYTNSTSTAFKPYLETEYNNAISDDRNEFYLDKNNKLYFYSIIGGEYKNLDNIPTCSVNDVNYTVKQQSKGVYYIDLNLSSDEFEPNSMIIDTWSNIVYNGKEFQDVELEFVALNPNKYFNFNNQNEQYEKYVPSIYGINYNEKVNREQEIKIFINPRVEYTTKMVKNLDNITYKLYIKEADGSEINIIEKDQVNKTSNQNFFTIYTQDLLPNDYYVDITINKYNETKTYKEKLKFTII